MTHRKEAQTRSSARRLGVGAAVAVGLAAVGLSVGATLNATAGSGDDGRDPGVEPAAPIGDSAVLDGPVVESDAPEFDTDSGLAPEAPSTASADAPARAVPEAPVDRDGGPETADQPAVEEAPTYLPGESGSDDQDG